MTIITIFSFQLVSLLGSEILDSLLSFEVPFNIKSLVFLINPDKSVTAITIHVPIAIGSSPVTEEYSDLVCGFMIQTQIVPHHIGILEIGLRISFLGMNKVWELVWIPYEENRSVVTSHVPVTLFSVELDGEPSRIPFSVGTSLFSSYCAESNQHWCFFPYLIKQSCLTVFCYVVWHFEITMSSTSFCMHYPFWNSFSVEMCKFIY